MILNFKVLKNGSLKLVFDNLILTKNIFLYIVKNPTFYKYFTSWDIDPRNRNVINSFITGKNAKYIEDLDNECLLEILYEMLVKCFPNFEWPKPLTLIKFKL